MTDLAPAYPPAWKRRAAASTILLAPVAALLVLLVGAKRVYMCLSLHPCDFSGYPPIPDVPIIGEGLGMNVSLGVLLVAFLGAAIWTARWMNRPALVDLIWAVIGCAVATAVLAGVPSFLISHSKSQALRDGLMTALLVTPIVAIVSLAAIAVSLDWRSVGRNGPVED